MPDPLSPTTKWMPLKCLATVSPACLTTTMLHCAVHLHKVNLYAHRSPPGLPSAPGKTFPLVKQWRYLKSIFHHQCTVSLQYNLHNVTAILLRLPIPLTLNYNKKPAKLFLKELTGFNRQSGISCCEIRRQDSACCRSISTNFLRSSSCLFAICGLSPFAVTQKHCSVVHNKVLFCAALSFLKILSDSEL